MLTPTHTLSHLSLTIYIPVALVAVLCYPNDDDGGDAAQWVRKRDFTSRNQNILVLSPSGAQPADIRGCIR